MNHRCVLYLLFASLCMGNVPFAFGQSDINTVYPEQVESFQNGLQEILVGCQLPGCIPATQLDLLQPKVSLHVTYELHGDARSFIDQLLFNVKNYPPNGSSEQIELSTGAQFVDGPELKVEILKGNPIRGRAITRTTLYNFFEANALEIDNQFNPSSIEIEIKLDQDSLNKIYASFLEKPENIRTDLGRLVLRVEQRIQTEDDDFSISEYELVYYFQTNPTQIPVPEDVILIPDNLGMSNAIVLVDGRPAVVPINGPCVNDQPFWGVDVVPIGNMLSNDISTSSNTCSSEAIVFSENHGIQLVDSIGWRNISGDSARITLPPKVLPPVVIRIADGDPTVRNMLRTTALLHIQRANELFTLNHTGIGFNTVMAAGMAAVDSINVEIREVSNFVSGGAVPASAIRDAVVPFPNTTAPTRGAMVSCPDAMYLSMDYSDIASDVINVYYVNTIPAFRGSTCDSGIIFIGSHADSETLAHELGHALIDLSWHPTSLLNDNDFNGDGILDFSDNNLMWPNVLGRSSFSKGQSFRMTFHEFSVLNQKGMRPPSQSPIIRRCSIGSIDDTCLWVGLNPASGSSIP